MTAIPAAAPAGRRRSDGVAATALAGVVVLLLFFGGVMGWAATTMLAGAVVVPGVVKVVSDRQPIKHQESGIVAEVAVTEGQEVVAGQLLLRLDATDLKALAEQLSGQVDKLHAEEARLVAERDGLAEIDVPENLRARIVEPRVREALTAEQDLFASRRSALLGEQNLLHQSIQQMEEQIVGRSAEVTSLDRQLQLILQETKDVRYLQEKGYAPKSKLLALERAAAAMEGQRLSVQSAIAETRKTIEQSRMRILQLERDRLAEVNDLQRQNQTALREAEPRLRATLHALGLTEIRAPLPGRVMALMVRAPGRVIQPSDVLMEIVPSEQTLVVEGAIRPEEVDDVAIGMAAEVKLTGLNSRLSPRLPAVVVNISADRMTDDRSGTAFYELQLSVDDAALAETKQLLGHRVSLLPGMPAQIAIATRERTVLEYLLSPLADGLERAMREP